MYGGPRRKSMAGPMLSAMDRVVSRSFTVTSTYHRGQTGTGDEMTGQSMAKEEELILDGKISIASSVETTKEIMCCKYTEHFDYLAAGFTDGAICLFKRSSIELVKTFMDLDIQDNPGPVTAIKHRPVHRNHPITNTLICSYVSGFVKCWNYNFGQCIYTIKEKRQTLGLAYHHRLPKFVTFGDDSRLFLYDEETRTQERVFQASDKYEITDGHTSRIFSAYFNPKSQHELISGGWDDTVMFWDTRVPQSTRHLSGVHICGDGLEISASGTEILTCAWQKENPLQLWDYGSGNLIANLDPDAYMCQLYSGKYLTKDVIACGGSDINLLRVVDLKMQATFGSIRGLRGGVYCIDTGPPKILKKGQSHKARMYKGVDVTLLPQIAFCADKKLYQVDYY